MKLSRVSRVVRLLTLLQSEKAQGVEELVEVTGVSRRTLFRDLKELSAIGVPYYFDDRAGGYKIEPEFFLPSVDLTLQEALSLLLLVHKGMHHLPLPFKNAALLAVLKIENNLPVPIRKYCDTSLRNVSIRPGAAVSMDGLDNVFGRLQQAIRLKNRVRMTYDSLYDGARIEVELEPYHLFYNNRAWYTAGRSSPHKQIRTFKLNRIIEMTVLESTFTGDGFDLHDYFGSAWSMIPEGRLYNIRLRFSSRVARNVAEVQWHRSQKVCFEQDGSMTAEFVVDGLGEISWWILGYGDQVEVLAPAELQKRIEKTADNMVRIHKK